MPRTKTTFIDNRHVLYTGWVLGQAIAAGLAVTPILSDSGDYTDRLKVNLPHPHDPAAPDVTIELVVPYPPADWTLL